jgi:hypothetical protein
MWETEGWHAGDVFGDGDAFRVELVQQFVGESEVCDAFFINSGTEVLMVTAGKAAGYWSAKFISSVREK